MAKLHLVANPLSVRFGVRISTFRVMVLVGIEVGVSIWVNLALHNFQE